jgi:hypothetical protein
MSTPAPPPPLASLGLLEGSWHPSPEALAAGYAARITYEDGPAWDGGARCGGGIRPGVRTIGRFLQNLFPQIHDVGGYNCRQNTANPSKTSMHGSGRALDLMIRPVGGGADNARGDVVANLLLVNAEWLGLQCLIWDRTIWAPDHRPTKFGPYGGPNPHVDHLHAEFTTAAAEMQTPFFAAGLTLPAQRRAASGRRGGLVVGLLAGLGALASAGAAWALLTDGEEGE